MSKETTATTLTDTAVVTEKPTDSQEFTKQLKRLQQENAKLREKLRQRDKEDEFIVRYIDCILDVRLSDLRNLLVIIPSLKNGDMLSSVVNSMHSILDEVKYDVDLICANDVDEIIYRYHRDKDKLLRGGEII